MSLIHPPGGLWGKWAKRIERISGAGAYLSLIIGALRVYVFPPSSMSSALGAILTILWTLLLCPALPAAWAAAVGKPALEYACLPWIAGALIVALVYAYGTITPESFTRVFFATSLTLLLTARYAMLHQLVKMARPSDE